MSMFKKGYHRIVGLKKLQKTFELRSNSWGFDPKFFLEKKWKDQCSNKNKLKIGTVKTTKLKNALSKFTKSKKLEKIFLVNP